ncbi:uncharacterized protein BJ171DRAFT_90706 [Polychytrium aggregatum]|uniref:uncharacterized protein n=1 Tax=Polychytrium aggregatum TaxID=110093 RepID=UPI0022FF331E|nr:uncharacterized protein BJ171DRAFT_90706 [Polychytrium aggregatum]KAI9204857.1 hypothetical protein BJ171DRAFT_90706 [Polychytrium aggregatum]
MYILRPRKAPRLAVPEASVSSAPETPPSALPLAPPEAQPAALVSFPLLASSPWRTWLVDLPPEVLELIFVYTDNPLALSRSCWSLQRISKSAIVRAKWLIRKYGARAAFEAGCRWMGLWSIELMEYLFQNTPKLPRYVIQRAFTRFQKKNCPWLIAHLLVHGLRLYSDLSLDKSDVQTFMELAACEPHAHILGTMSHSARKLEAIKSLVSDYGFDVNFMKWTLGQSPIPVPQIKEGYRALLCAVSSKNTPLVKTLLECNAMTHVPLALGALKVHNRTASEMILSQLHQTISLGLWNWTDRVIDNSPLQLSQSEWAKGFFPVDLRHYLTCSADAVLIAAKTHNQEIMRMLLDHDLDRWETSHGVQVLKSVLQFCIDDGYNDGIQLLQNYITTKKIGHMQRSPFALRRALIEACISSNLESVATLIDEGARFEIDDRRQIYGFAGYLDPLKMIITSENTRLLSFLMQRYMFNEASLRQMLVLAIEGNVMSAVRVLLNSRQKVRFAINEKVLRRTVVSQRYEIMPLLLRELKKTARETGRLITGFGSVLRFAERRMISGKDDPLFYDVLVEYQRYLQTCVEKNRLKSRDKAHTKRCSTPKASSSSAKGKGRMIEDPTEDAPLSQPSPEGPGSSSSYVGPDDCMSGAAAGSSSSEPVTPASRRKRQRRVWWMMLEPEGDETAGPAAESDPVNDSSSSSPESSPGIRTRSGRVVMPPNDT